MTVGDLLDKLGSYPDLMEVELSTVFYDSPSSSLRSIGSDGKKVVLRDHLFAIRQRDEVTLSDGVYVVPYGWEGKVSDAQ